MARRKRRRRWPVMLAILGTVPLAALAYYAWLPSADPLVDTIPKRTALMEQRLEEGKIKGVRRQIVPLSRIAPLMVRAVVLSEDAKFHQHDGFDWEEIGNSVEENLERGGFARGGSTITQQLAKNLWLGTRKTLARKANEALLAVKLERALTKARILEIYLNVVEWGPGVFGVEAAARTHFGVSAAELRPHQIALLVAMLPAPRRANPNKPSKALSKRARRVMGLIASSGEIDPGLAAAETAALEARLRR